MAPSGQSKSSSIRPSQLSSIPLQLSVIGISQNGPGLQPSTHSAEPRLPQLVTQPAGLPSAHSNPSSIVPSQSLSRPSHVSASGKIIASVSSQSSRLSAKPSEQLSHDEMPGWPGAPCPSRSLSG